jgi:hypothetical protein
MIGDHGKFEERAQGSPAIEFRFFLLLLKPISLVEVDTFWKNIIHCILPWWWRPWRILCRQLEGGFGAAPCTVHNVRSILHYICVRDECKPAAGAQGSPAALPSRNDAMSHRSLPVSKTWGRLVGHVSRRLFSD